MAGGVSRRAVLSLGAAAALPCAQAQPVQPAPVWIDEPRRSISVMNRGFTGIGYAQEPHDAREAAALDDALGRAGLRIGPLFVEAVRSAAAASPDLEGVANAPDERSAAIEIEPRVFLWAMTGDRARLQLWTKVDADLPGVRSFDLDCRTFTSLVLPNKGEGSWTDEGFRTLRQAVSRCARDLVLLVQTEASMRRRGVWKSPVEMERLQLVEYKVYSGWDPLRDEALVIRETDTTLCYAVAHGRGLGHLRNIRHIIDKPLITQRGPA